jgi:hypothetical protein
MVVTTPAPPPLELPARVEVRIIGTPFASVVVMVVTRPAVPFVPGVGVGVGVGVGNNPPPIPPSPPFVVPLMTTQVVAPSMVIAALSQKSSKLKFWRFVASNSMPLKASL